MKIEKNLNEVDTTSLVDEIESVDISIFSELEPKYISILQKYRLLTEPQKRILALYTYLRTYKAVAEVLGVHSYTVKAYINEIKKQFRNDIN